ncbi:hypothetical protein FJT64_010676 [Amphibalanus amphitrite]|uniref:Uncharacterized protein n=1 Tax=Amphibalanus amphitrite TaxID=1232801 RepID=A0A6A4V9B0_AMPAM|nr:hypothetical protein FJT64_010676 [Amphibalanus amphitrite]
MVAPFSGVLRRSALKELSGNTPSSGGRCVTRRQPSLLAEPASPPATPPDGDLMSFESPLPAAGRRHSRRLATAARH